MDEAAIRNRVAAVRSAMDGVNRALADLEAELNKKPAPAVEAPMPKTLAGLTKMLAETAPEAPIMHVNKPQKPQIEINDEWQKVIDYVLARSGNAFITGNAGTGKTTLLEVLKARYPGDFAIAAPTGVAALRAGGMTIHRLFHFGAHALEKGEVPTLKDDTKKKFQSMETLFLDEASMIRADLMDAIDAFMRKNGKDEKQPFGGTKVVLIGDLFQLPPVAKDGKEKDWLADRYGTDVPYFFHAECFRDIRPKIFELTKVFRQKDMQFTDALNAIRRGQMSPEHLMLINSRVNTNFVAPPNELWPILCTRNDDADTANKRMLAQLPGESKTFSATIYGEFPVKDAPTDQELTLKVGTIVMFVKNDGYENRYVNGTIGKVLKLNPLIVETPDHGDVELEPTEWESVVYDYDTRQRKLTKKVQGTFRQYPLRHGAAITIHKCLSGNSLVSTANNGLLPIKWIKPGDSVYTSDGTIQRVRLASLIGERRTLYLRTKGGREVRCTPEHKLCVNHNGNKIWIEAAKIEVGSLLVTPSFDATDSYLTCLPLPEYSARSKKLSLPATMTIDLAWWLGVMIGDGSYFDRSEGTFWLTVSSSEVRDRFITITESFGISVGQRKKPKNHSFDLWFNSVPFRTWLEKIGLSHDHAETKHIPSTVLRADSSIRAAFARGLFDTDGSVNGIGHIIFTTVSEQLASDLQHLLDSLGIESRKARPQAASYKKNGVKILTGKTSYPLRICGHAEPKFINLVGFTRQDRLSRWKAKDWSQEKCNKSSLIPHTDEVVEILDGQVEQVFDLEIENNHNFFADGLLVSNSQGLTLERVVVDFGTGAFAAGQAYVALSRATSLKGLVLRRPLQMRDVFSSTEVHCFMTGKPISRPKPRQPTLMDVVAPKVQP